MHQIELHLGVPDAQEVAVTLDETRDGEPSLEVDDLGAATDVSGDLSIASDGENRVVEDRDRLGLRVGVVHRDNLAVPEHEVGGDLRLGGAAHHQGNRATKYCSEQRPTSNLARECALPHVPSPA